MFGQVLFEGETMADDHIFHLYELLDVSQQDGVFAFMDKSEVRELDVQLLMPNNGKSGECLQDTFLKENRQISKVDVDPFYLKLDSNINMSVSAHATAFKKSKRNILH